MTQRLNDLANLGDMLHPLLMLSPGVRHIYLIYIGFGSGPAILSNFQKKGKMASKNMFLCSYQQCLPPRHWNWTRNLSNQMKPVFRMTPVKITITEKDVGIIINSDSLTPSGQAFPPFRSRLLWFQKLIGTKPKKGFTLCPVQGRTKPQKAGFEKLIRNIEFP